MAKKSDKINIDVTPAEAKILSGMGMGAITGLGVAVKTHKQVKPQMAKGDQAISMLEETIPKIEAMRVRPAQRAAKAKNLRELAKKLNSAKKIRTLIKYVVPSAAIASGVGIGALTGWGNYRIQKSYAKFKKENKMTKKAEAVLEKIATDTRERLAKDYAAYRAQEQGFKQRHLALQKSAPGKGFSAFDSKGNSLGDFKTEAEAEKAIRGKTAGILGPRTDAEWDTAAKEHNSKTKTLGGRLLRGAPVKGGAELKQRRMNDHAAMMMMGGAV
jgi:hypothetical protein